MYKVVPRVKILPYNEEKGYEFIPYTSIKELESGLMERCFPDILKFVLNENEKKFISFHMMGYIEQEDLD